MTTWFPQPFPPYSSTPRAPFTITAPSGRVIGASNDPLLLGQFHRSGYTID